MRSGWVLQQAREKYDTLQHHQLVQSTSCFMIMKKLLRPRQQLTANHERAAAVWLPKLIGVPKARRTFSEINQNCRRSAVSFQPTVDSFVLFQFHHVRTLKPMWKLKHANSILEIFEYFCQISSKLILIIFSYTVSKLVHFLRHQIKTALLQN